MYSADIVCPQEGWSSTVFWADYQNLKAVTVSDAHPFQTMVECMNLLGNARVLSKLDAVPGHLQNETEEEEKNKMAVTFHHETLCFI